jgi:hypothetical protein
MKLIQIFNILIRGNTMPLRRLYSHMAALISIMTLPVSALAETAAGPATADTHARNFAPAANAAGFFIALPAVDSDQLIERIRTHRASLTHREHELRQYLDAHQLDSKDVLITIIMPGGLLYAAVKKGNLDQAEAELDQITADMDEFSRDLVAMQAMAGDLTVAQLQ